MFLCVENNSTVSCFRSSTTEAVGSRPSGLLAGVTQLGLRGRYPKPRRIRVRAGWTHLSCSIIMGEYGSVLSFKFPFICSFKVDREANREFLVFCDRRHEGESKRRGIIFCP